MRNIIFLTWLSLNLIAVAQLHSLENSKAVEPKENFFYVNTCGIPYVICIGGDYEYSLPNKKMGNLSIGLSVQFGSELFSITEGNTGNETIKGLNIRGNYGLTVGKVTLYSEENFSGWYLSLAFGSFWQKIIAQEDICDNCALLANKSLVQSGKITAGFGGGYSFDSERLRFLLGFRIMYAENFQIPYAVMKNNSQIQASASVKNLGYPFAGTLVAAIGYVF